MAVAIAFIAPGSFDGSLKSQNSFVSTQPLGKKSIPIESLGIQLLTVFPDKAKLAESSSLSADSSDLETDLCNQFRLSIIQETPTGTHIFLSECSRHLKGDKLILSNSFAKAPAYEMPKSLENFQDMSVADIKAAKVGSADALEFNDYNTHWIWII